MCGIVGALTPGGAIDRATIERLNQAQHHRGPDHDVVASFEGGWLGNTRLAIQDPTPVGNQPFADPSGRFVAVFNGEIYNFAELVRAHRLEVRTGCDTEIVPLLWARFGSACLELFRGMFAVAVYDTVERRLHLARDPFGIKPLCWRPWADGIVFASEPKPLWRMDRTATVNDAAIAEFLHFGALGADQTPFAGIEAIAPGACVSFAGPGAPRTELIIDALDPVGSSSLAPERDHTDRPLADALRGSAAAHLVSGVPTSLLLSAGVDSALLAFAAHGLGEHLHCLTVTGAMGDNESPQARATAEEFGHTHEDVEAVLDDQEVGAFFAAMQRPTVDGLNTFLVSRAVRSAGFKIALSGLGGDEALGGYSTARLAQLAPLLRAVDRLPARVTAPVLGQLRARVPALASGKAARLLAPDGPRSEAAVIDLQRELFSTHVIADLGVPPPIAPVPSQRQPSDELPSETRPPVDTRGFRAMASAEVIRYLQPVLLPDSDAFSMASSVELRVPFVDRPFFAAAMTRRHLRGKPELVSQLGNRYLKLLSTRPKTGFSVPMQKWMGEGALAEVVRDAARPDAPLWSHIDRRHGLPILERSSERWSERWALAALDGWLRSL